MYKQYLLVQNIVIGVSYKRSVVCMEKLLTRNLSKNNKHSVLVGMRPCTVTITSSNDTYSSFGSRNTLPFDVLLCNVECAEIFDEKLLG